jgi:hypothetical protein
MTILGIIGLIITLLIIVPASLLALIKVFTHPVREITLLWINLAETLFDIYEKIKADIRSLK